MFVSGFPFRGTSDATAQLPPKQQCQPGECEPSRGVVHHVDLAGVKAGLKLSQRDIQLEYDGTSIPRIQLFYFLQRTLISLHLPLEKGDVGQRPDARIVPTI